MKNIEKYTNTNDALAAYNALDLKKVPFDVWLECKFEEPRVPTLLEAAAEMVYAWKSEFKPGYPARVSKAIGRLSDAIEREKCKPVRNLDKYKTANEATKWFKEMCNGISNCVDCHFRYDNCAIAWLYEEAGKGDARC